MSRGDAAESVYLQLEITEGLPNGSGSKQRLFEIYGERKVSENGSFTFNYYYYLEVAYSVILAGLKLMVILLPQPPNCGMIIGLHHHARQVTEKKKRGLRIESGRIPTL